MDGTALSSHLWQARHDDSMHPLESRGHVWVDRPGRRVWTGSAPPEAGAEKADVVISEAISRILFRDGFWDAVRAATGLRPIDFDSHEETEVASDRAAVLAGCCRRFADRYAEGPKQRAVEVASQQSKNGRMVPAGSTTYGADASAIREVVLAIADVADVAALEGCVLQVWL